MFIFKTCLMSSTGRHVFFKTCGGKVTSFCKTHFVKPVLRHVLISHKGVSSWQSMHGKTCCAYDLSSTFRTWVPELIYYLKTCHSTASRCSTPSCRKLFGSKWSGTFGVYLQKRWHKIKMKSITWWFQF